MDDFLSAADKENLSKHVRPETLEPCFKRPGKKNAMPHYNRPTHVEVRKLAQIVGLEGSALGLSVGVDGRQARRWQSPSTETPLYSEWTLLCLLAAKKLAQ